jgi:hypothetical protein
LHLLWLFDSGGGSDDNNSNNDDGSSDGFSSSAFKPYAVEKVRGCLGLTTDRSSVLT